jgi:hypothetical protein
MVLSGSGMTKVLSGSGMTKLSASDLTALLRRISEHEQADHTRQQADLTQAAWQPAANHGSRVRLAAEPA